MVCAKMGVRNETMESEQGRTGIDHNQINSVERRCETDAMKYLSYQRPMGREGDETLVTSPLRDARQ